jgi:hypothetical protein
VQNRGKYPLCNKEENVFHELLKGNETQKWGEQFLGSVWLQMNEQVTHREVINSNKIIKI